MSAAPAGETVCAAAMEVASDDSAVPAAPTRLIDRVRAMFDADGMAGTLAQGAIWSFTMSIGGMIASLGVQVLLARAIGEAEYGVYVYALAWMNITLLFAKLEFDVLALRFVGAYSANAQWPLLRGFLVRGHQVVALLSLAIGTAGAVAIWVLRDTLPHLPDSATSSLWLTCALLPLAALLQFGAGCLQGFQKVVQSQAPGAILRPVLFGAGIAWFAWVQRTRLTATEAIGINLAATVVAIVVMWKLLRDAIPAEVSRSETTYRSSEWMHTGAALLVIALAQLVVGPQSDLVVVGTFVGASAAGIYGVAVQLASLVSFGVTALMFMANPMIAKLDAQGRGRDTELQRLVTMVGRASLAVSLPVVALLLVQGRTLLGLFGPKFVAGYPILLILTGSQFMVAIVGMLAGFLLVMTGHQRPAVIAVGATAILNLVLTLFLTPAFGPLGTATATAIATFARSATLIACAWRLRGVRVLPLGPMPHARSGANA